MKKIMKCDYCENECMIIENSGEKYCHLHMGQVD